MLPGVTRPCWLVCEDGREYLERFTRFLGARFTFEAAPDAQALLTRLTQPGAPPVAGVLLDLDFRRTPPARLVDEQGRAAPDRPEATSRRLAATQGLHILKLLRARGLRVPALLCADFDDPAQVAYLEGNLAPLAIAPSHEGLAQTAARMSALTAIWP
jgi:hypothetical protein